MIVNTRILPALERMNTLASLLAVVADGASVMSGCYEGVAARLAWQYPWLIYIHCATHRLNLAVRQLLQDLNVCDILDAAKSLCSSVGVPTTFEDPIHIRRETSEDPATQINFCQDLKKSSIPLILKKVDRRFKNDNVKVLAAMDSLDASKEHYLDHQAMCPLVSQLDDCQTADVGLLKSECEQESIVIKAGESIDMNLYSNLDELIKI